MGWEPVPAAAGVNQCCASHAHPMPRTNEPSSPQTIRELFADVGIDLQLRGLLGEDRCKITDVYCPEVRRSPTTKKQAANHLDVVSCWKGMSFPQASEIAYWESTFKLALEQLVLEVVIRVFAEHVCHEHEPIDKFTIIPSLIKFIATWNRHIIDVTVPDLVTDMIERFYEDGSNRRCTWFTSSHDLSAMVFNFLRTRDCFLDSFPYPILEVNFSCDRIGSGLCIFGTIAWQLPVIDFHDLPDRLPTGAEYRVSSRYRQPILSESFTLFPAEPEFIVTSKSMSLAWDTNKRCFRAIVPHDRSYNSQESSAKMETMFQATIVTNFPGDVRFEQTTRYSIVLEIESPRPPLTVSTAQSDPVPMDIVSPSEEAVSIHLSPARDVSPPRIREPERSSTPQDHTNPWLPSYFNTTFPELGRHVLRRWMSEESLNTSSVDRGMEAQSHHNDYALRPYIVVSCGVGSQVDLPNQNIFPGDKVDIGLHEKAESDAESEATRSLDALVNGDPKYGFDRYSHLWNKQSTAQGQGRDSSGETAAIRHASALVTDLAIREAIGKRAMVHDPDNTKETLPSPWEKIDCFDSLQEHCFGARSVLPAELRVLKTITQEPFPEVLPGDDASTSTCKTNVPQKRKATKQLRRNAIFETPAAADHRRRLLETLMLQNPELAAKRQRLSERIDSGISDVTEFVEGEPEDLPHSMAGATTGTPEEAFSLLTEPVERLKKMKGDAGHRPFHDLRPSRTRRVPYFARWARPADFVLPLREKKAKKSKVDHKFRGLKTNCGLPTPPSSTVISPTDGLPPSATSKLFDSSSASKTTFIGSEKANAAQLATLESLRDNPKLNSADLEAVNQIMRKLENRFDSPVGGKEEAQLGNDVRALADTLANTETIEQTMRKIQENYDDFLKEKEQRGSGSLNASDAQDDDQKAMERVFLQGSEGSGEAMISLSESSVGWESESDLSDMLEKGLKIDEKGKGVVRPAESSDFDIEV